jgi:nitroreductase
MDVREAIITRRSIRSFLDRKVERATIDKILEAAIYAPSASNLQPWKFIALDDPALIEKACRLNLDAYWGFRAPAAILVLSDESMHRSKAFWAQGCAAVTQNILLLVHDAGLGGTWTGVYPEEDRIKGLRRLLRLPDSIIPFSLVLFGYPKRKGAEKSHSLEGRLGYNRLGEKLSTRYSYSSDPLEGKTRRSPEDES